MTNKVKLLEALTTTSDGKLKGGNAYDDFILAIIDDNTNKAGKVDIIEVNGNFSYMISELYKAQKILEKLKK